MCNRHKIVSWITQIRGIREWHNFQISFVSFLLRRRRPFLFELTCPKVESPATKDRLFSESRTFDVFSTSRLRRRFYNRRLRRFRRRLSPCFCGGNCRPQILSVKLNDKEKPMFYYLDVWWTSKTKITYKHLQKYLSLICVSSNKECNNKM